MRVYPLIPGLLKQKQLGPLHVPETQTHMLHVHARTCLQDQGLLSSACYRSDYRFTSKHFGTDLPPKTKPIDLCQDHSEATALEKANVNQPFVLELIVTFYKLF